MPDRTPRDMSGDVWDTERSERRREDERDPLDEKDNLEQRFETDPTED